MRCPGTHPKRRAITNPRLGVPDGDFLESGDHAPQGGFTRSRWPHEGHEFMVQNRQKVDPLLTRSFSFRDYREAYAFIEENRESVMKVMIDLDGLAEASRL